jgi:hypothetical protein
LTEQLPVVAAHAPPSLPIVILTQRAVIKGVLARFTEQYRNYPRTHTFPSGATVGRIIKRLNALDTDTASRDDVNRAMALRNGNWADLDCDCCGKHVEAVARVGDSPDYDNRWQDLCIDCLQIATNMLARLGASTTDASQDNGMNSTLSPKPEGDL